MSYKEVDFDAISGNHCRLKIYPPQPSGSQPINCTWETEPSQQDIDALNKWFIANHAPPNCLALLSARVPDEDDREAIVRQMLAESN